MAHYSSREPAGFHAMIGQVNRDSEKLIAHHEEVIDKPDKPNIRRGRRSYLIADWTVENVVLSFVPTPVITGIIATAIPAAIRPYSIAVAAPSSFKNLKIRATSNVLSLLQSTTRTM